MMHAFDVLGDPVRRQILELLAKGEHRSGDIVTVIQDEFGISQGTVSQHLKALSRREGRDTFFDEAGKCLCSLTTADSKAPPWKPRHE